MPAKAYAEVLIGLAADLTRMSNARCRSAWSRSPATPTRATAPPRCCSALLLDRRRRPDEALAVLAVPAADPLARRSATQARILLDRSGSTRRCASPRPRLASSADGQRLCPARRRAPAQALRRGGGRLQPGDRHGQGPGRADDFWPLHLLRATRLEEANRWPEAKKTLHAALAMAPNSR